MTITTTRLSRSAGLSAVAAGLLFILVQFIHPHEDVAAVTTTAWTVTLPHAVGRMLAVPVGLALAGLGYSLWRGERTAAGRSLPGVRSSRLDPVGAE
jgi:hypothetical protein